MSRRRKQMVCQELVAKVDAYLDDELNADTRRALEEHLAVCDHCTAYVHQVRRILELTAATPPAPLPAGALEQLQERWRTRR